MHCCKNTSNWRDSHSLISLCVIEYFVFVCMMLDNFMDMYTARSRLHDVHHLPERNRKVHLLKKVKIEVCAPAVLSVFRYFEQLQQGIRAEVWVKWAKFALVESLF
ncbi:hypothetical protein N7G274_009222 [Stereocaulon virgatum]|uniref:Uncharacterized protein n=1 Tax=Stereocaulon virgatum TaxID=373712 RepID=A0ABR3ZWJ8_9LECA